MLIASFLGISVRSQLVNAINCANKQLRFHFHLPVRPPWNLAFFPTSVWNSLGGRQMKIYIPHAPLQFVQLRKVLYIRIYWMFKKYSSRTTITQINHLRSWVSFLHDVVPDLSTAAPEVFVCVRHFPLKKIVDNSVITKNPILTDSGPTDSKKYPSEF